MRTKLAINGILLLDKPIDISSNGALQRCKWLFSAKKAGHTGSLDPLATGMLPLCFGEATKFSQFLLDSDKAYTVTAKLGERTNTGDGEGEIIAVCDVPADLTTDKLESILSSFRGVISQIPPMYSAIKHQGRPLYELARQGVEIERAARQVTIHELVLDHYDAVEQTLTLNVKCTKCTYIRTLLEDIGTQLGCGAHVIELRRTMVEPYANKRMYTLPELEQILEASGMTGLQQCLLPIQTSVAALPAIQLTTAAAFYLRQGQPVRATLPIASPLVQLFADTGQFLGVGEVTEDGRVKPQRLLTQAA